MQSPLAFVFASTLVETLHLRHLPHLCSWPIQYALAQLITLPEGKILRQSFSSFLAHIDVFEYTLDHDFTMTYSRIAPSICMLMIFDGHFSLYHPSEKLISENPAGAFRMGYINKGNYIAKIKAGKTKIVLLTLRADWMMGKMKRLAHFKPISTQFNAAKQPNFYLADCPITLAVSTLTKKMLLHDGRNQEDLDETIGSVLNQLINQYHEMIDKGALTTNAVHEKQAREIATFVRKNYSDSIVDDVSRLALHFNVSKRQLVRLAKIAFQMPLHQYIISIRMNTAMVKLISSNRPIHEIAAEVGYQNAHYFSTAFKNYHQILPSEVHGLRLKVKNRG